MDYSAGTTAIMFEKCKDGTLGECQLGVGASGLK
jgi:hypothetical protein